jgi:Glycosyl transferase family 2
MTSPLVSVITPVGPRHSQHALTAIASVKWQSVAAQCEHILACDGGAIVPEIDGITILPSDGERRGPAHTRNRALAQARGAFVVPLDADDYLTPRCIEHFLREYSRGTHGYIYGDAYTEEPWHRLDQFRGQSMAIVHEAEQRIWMHRSAPDYNQAQMAYYNLHVVTGLFPTKHAWAVGGYDEGVDAWEDWSFHLRLAIRGICGYRLAMPVFVYRVYEGDRMTRFYNGDPVLMDKVKERYQNKQGVIEMAGCCGGDAPLAQAAWDAVKGLQPATARRMEEDMIRIEYLGPERGSIPFEPSPGRVIRLGNNAMNRYADVTPEEAAWVGQRANVRVVPNFDSPDRPPPLAVVAQAITPEAEAVALVPEMEPEKEPEAHTVPRRERKQEQAA